jgi:excisionase family DNA binding protein
MAKMFYTLEEAAQKLGVDEQAIKDMAARNELQQFRDGDKLMFKRDQVDAKSSSGGSDGPMELADSGIEDAIDLKNDTAVGVEPESPNEATGVSVFDAGEIDLADPMAQTQVTGPMIDDEELALESVGSGSGLLDLTRESDDTSLGAELLDEIYPGSDTNASATGISMESAVGSSGVFDGEISMETGTSGPSGLENLSGAEPAAPAPAAGATRSTTTYEEPNDPAGSLFGAGMLFGVLLAMIVGLAAIVPAIYGVEGTLVSSLYPKENGAYQPTNVYAVAGGILAVSVIFGVVGMVIGKSSAR